MITLQLGEASAVVAPESGGALAGWTRGPARLLRMPLPEAMLALDVHAMGYFPLLPYANRIGEARFTWDGQVHQLRHNMPGHPHSLHGVGWARAWDIAALEEAAVTLTLRHEPDEDWPFAFEAEERIELLPDGLRLALSLTNCHSGPAPAGIGFHPYFPRAEAADLPPATLRFAADGVWQTDPTLLPDTRTAIPPDWDHEAGEAVGQAVLDNCFTGWRGRAEIAWRSYGLHVEADKLFDHLQVYTPAGQSFFAVEPVSHAPDAINRGGMRALAPQETLSGAVLLRFTGA